MKVIFMGTPDFAVPTLHALIQNDNYDVVAVFSQPPKQKGRKLQITKSPVQILAEIHNIPVYTPTNLKTPKNQQEIFNIDADVIIVAAYGFIIPLAILNNKKYGCINIHPSSLPRHRGAAPLQHTILNGDNTSSICIMQMDKGLDTGDILLEENFSLPPHVTIQELHDQCAHRGAELLIQTLDNIENITPTPQIELGATYAHKITKQHGVINWHTMDAQTIERMVRAFTPWPGVFFRYNNMPIKILETKLVTAQSSDAPGIIIDNQLTIHCKEGAIQPTILQKPGKKPAKVNDFLNGTPIPQGTQL